MADKTYTVNQESPESITGFETFNSQDVSLINSFEVNTLFNPDKNFMELHVVSLIDEVLESDYNYTSYKQLGNAQSAGNSGASVLTLDPVADVKRYGYENGSVKLLYHFLNDLFSETKTPVEFFIENISEDRTELRLQTFQLTAEQIVERVNEVKAKLYDQSFFSEFRLDFKNNDLFIGVNIDTVDLGFDKVVVVKLYEPLPVTYVEKSTLSIVEIIADSVAYEIDYEVTEDEPVQFSLKPTNFNLDIIDDSTIPTGYYNYDELFSYPVNNSNSQIYSMISQKGIELSIDHTDYSNFVHFSSAQERLLNFKYKLDLISSSYASIEVLNTATRGMSGVSGSQTYHNGIIEGILNNFDHYERFLYYESGSSSWPKSNSVKPYINQSSSTLQSSNWFTNQLANAVGYDLSNTNSILSAIPSYIKDDTDNESYLTFMFMIGQHFDLLWIYAKAVSDKYDADNRLDHGIPKDLVGEALKNFGIKLYTSNKSIEDLFTTITGQSYQSGSEVVKQYITGSLTGSNIPVQPVSYDGYTKEVQKRLYHNLPLLLKSKGTERGLRALINCFGIPSDTLQVKLYGGQNTSITPFFGDLEYYTSSLDKVRVDNTGSLISGNTLSPYVSTVKQDKKYTDDIHVVEVGFSPTDNVNSYIISKSLDTFNIDDYIGDPRNLYDVEYAIVSASGNPIQTLTQLTEQIMTGSTGYNVYEYVRLIKFFDNTIFKMVKDFIPARSVADTGIVIKPHILQRSKAKSVLTTATEAENLLTGSIVTGSVSGSHGNTFGSRDQYSTAYSQKVQTPFGIGTRTNHLQQEAKYDGELSGSQLTVTNGELTEDNPYLTVNYVTSVDNLQYISASINCDLTAMQPSPRLVSSGIYYLLGDFFGGVADSGMQYTIIRTNSAGPNIPIQPEEWPYQFTTPLFQQYDTFTIQANNTNSAQCVRSVDCVFGTCNISVNNETYVPLIDLANPEFTSVNLLSYFNIGANPQYDQLQVTLIINEGPNQVIRNITIAQAQAFTSSTLTDYQFDNSDTLAIVLTDLGLASVYTCESRVDVIAAYCTLDHQLTGMQEQAYPWLGTLIQNSTLNSNYSSHVLLTDPTTGIGSVGKYYLTDSYLVRAGTDQIQLNVGPAIIAGGIPDSGLGRFNANLQFTQTGGTLYPYTYGFTYENPGFSPIHHTLYQYPGESSTKNMTEEYPYLTNPNYIFENLNTDGNPNGIPRQKLPVLRNGIGESSDLSGYQVGLASFFTGLRNLNDVYYEVYIYDVPQYGGWQYNDPNQNNLVFAATDYDFDYNYNTPWIGGNGSGVGNGQVVRTGAIKPNTDSTTPVANYINADNGVSSQGGIKFWTYDTPAYNNGSNAVPGYVAKLDLNALIEDIGFGKKVVQTSPSEYRTGYADLVQIFAYSPDPDGVTSVDTNPNPRTPYGYTCVASVAVIVEGWIRVNQQGGTGGVG